LRFAKAFQEVVGFRVIEQCGERRAVVHRQAEFVWDVWDRATAFALSG
jgi:hypothetical protein